MVVEERLAMGMSAVKPDEGKDGRRRQKLSMIFPVRWNGMARARLRR